MLSVTGSSVMHSISLRRCEIFKQRAQLPTTLSTHSDKRRRRMLFSSRRLWAVIGIVCFYFIGLYGRAVCFYAADCLWRLTVCEIMKTLQLTLAGQHDSIATSDSHSTHWRARCKFPCEHGKLFSLDVNKLRAPEQRARRLSQIELVRRWLEIIDKLNMVAEMWFAINTQNAELVTSHHCCYTDNRPTLSKLPTLASSFFFCIIIVVSILSSCWLHGQPVRWI